MDLVDESSASGRRRRRTASVVQVAAQESWLSQYRLKGLVKGLMMSYSKVILFSFTPQERTVPVCDSRLVGVPYVENVTVEALPRISIAYLCDSG